MKTICNPLNIEYRYQFFQKAETETTRICEAHREAADPTLISFKGQYYLFPSMTAGFWVSDDLMNWRFHELKGEMDVYDYAPDVAQVGDYLYLSASKMNGPCSFYRSKDPINEPFTEVKTPLTWWDPALFCDEDGRVYHYWGSSNINPLMGVELDSKTMQPIGEPVALMNTDEDHIGYERGGEDHYPRKTREQIEKDVEELFRKIPGATEEIRPMLYQYMGNRPYLEGAYMTKHAGRYYLQYAVPGAQWNTYCDGVCVSESPLGPFQPAKNNPYSYVPRGFITGAGHGSTMKDNGGRYWHVSTMRISKNQQFERRLGLWKAGFDADGELWCDQRYADWPTDMDAAPFTKPGWMLLSYKAAATASSGTGAGNISDENIRTWWQAAERDGQWAQLDLGESKTVCAVQVNFSDCGVKTEISKDLPVLQDFSDARYIDTEVQATRWLLEGSADGERYETLCDKSATDTDLSHDLVCFEEGKELRYLRLRIVSLPYGALPTVSGLRVFGLGHHAAPEKAKNVRLSRTADGMDMTVSFDADGNGHNILWGCAPDKLYHSFIAYEGTEHLIRALVAGQDVYVRVDSFNDSAITEGDVQKL